MEERPVKKKGVETVASKPVYVSERAWAEFEALDNPWAWDDEVENEQWFEEDIEDAIVYTDEDEDNPYWILMRLLNPYIKP